LLTCNQLDLETLGSPPILPQTSPNNTPRMWNMQLVWDDYQIQIRLEALAIFLMIFGHCINILFFITWRFSFLLTDHIGSPNYVIQPSMVNKFWEHRAISFEHAIPFWCPYLNPHLTSDNSNISVQLR
jgi:hypothetical protein